MKEGRNQNSVTEVIRSAFYFVSDTVDHPEHKEGESCSFKGNTH